MSENIALWHAEHVNFARLLGLLEEQLDLFYGGDVPNYELMLDVMYYMTHYPDLFHHPREDMAFEKIRDREIAARPVVDELVRQHVLLRESGERLHRDLDDIVNGSILSREHIEEPCRTYIANFRSHMEQEETDILPVASRVLHDADWAEINAAVRHREDPLFGKNVEKRYAAILEQIAIQAA